MRNLQDLVTEAFAESVANGFSEHPDKKTAMVLVIGELSELVDADHKGHTAYRNLDVLARVEKESVIQVQERIMSWKDKRFKSFFEDNVKDTMEDEIADTVIRICNYLGSLGYEMESAEPFNPKTAEAVQELMKRSTLPQNALDFMETICLYVYENLPESHLERVVHMLFAFADVMNVHLMWHIEAKIRYNRLRGYKYGKKY